ncbi:MAG: SRPBCC family protein [Polyangiales bacterium]|nr:SRPBCC domain-containing protein [Myxococcales bacterium]
MAKKAESNEINITRLYDAPVRAVWDAWTDPEQVAKWWGPRGFTITTHSKDLRPGGSWVYTMHGPDGTDYPNRTHYFEVEECKRLVYDHGANESQPALFRVTVVFSEVAGKTKMDMTMALATPEAAAETRKRIQEHGGNATWDRLGEYLAHDATGDEIFIINRTFDAPIERMFEVWTNPKHMAQWVAPKGMEMRFIRARIEPGGSSFYSMGNGAMTMYGRAHYLEVRRPDRIVYTQEFCDENENPSVHPAAPTWPKMMLTTVTFASEGPDQTRVTVRWQPHNEVSAESLATFVAGRAGMTGGWTGSFDKLEAYLAESN